MSVALALGLLGLALIDSTSFGTLLIPVWLLLTPGPVRGGRVVRYLTTIVVFYFLAGIALAAGASRVIEAVRAVATDIPATALIVTQLVAGIAIIALSYWLEARAKVRQGKPGKLTRWRNEAMTEAGAGGGLTRLAVIAAALEVATMLPYLIAIGLLANADIGLATFGASLAAYCLMMVLPALILTVIRLAARERIEAFLQRLSNWFARNSARAIGWTVGGIGVSVTLNAAVRLVVVA